MDANATLISTTTAAAEQTTLNLESAVLNIERIIDYGWGISGSALVFVMQVGFGMLEAGASRAKNTQNIMLKKALDICVGGLSFAVFGYGLGFGVAPEGISTAAGFSYFFLDQMTDFKNYMINWIFCCIATTIVSGAIAERTRLLAYAIYVVWLVAIVYPFIMRWVWNEVGFLRQMGAHDFAGSGVVHLTGGTAALMGCINVGARQGRFEKDGKVNEIRAHSMSLYWLGSMLLWFGWFFFNGVSSGGLSAGGVEKSGRAMVNTAIGGSSGGLAAFLVYWAMHRVQRLDVLLSGVLAGCVGITANCDVIYAWSACGPGEYIGVQLLVVVVIFFWTAILVGGAFFLLRLFGLLRVSEAEELAGLDVTSHGGSAYSAAVQMKASTNPEAGFATKPGAGPSAPIGFGNTSFGGNASTSSVGNEQRSLRQSDEGEPRRQRRHKRKEQRKSNN